MVDVGGGRLAHQEIPEVPLEAPILEFLFVIHKKRKFRDMTQ